MSSKKENKQSDYQRTLKAFRYFYKIIWGNWKLFFICNFFALIARACVPFFGIIFPKLIIDELLSSRNPDTLVFYAALFILGENIINAIDSICTQTYQKIVDQINRYFEMQYNIKCLDMDFEYTENPEILDKARKAFEGLQWYGGVENLTSIACGILSAILAMSGSGIIIASCSPWLLLIVIAGLILFAAVNRQRNKADIENKEIWNILGRKFDYYGWQISDPKYGKDIRLYDAADMIMNRTDMIMNEMVVSEKKLCKRNTVCGIIDAVTNSASMLGIYLIIGYKAVTKAVSIGDFTMYANAANTFEQQINTIVQNLQQMLQCGTCMCSYVDFMESLVPTFEYGNRKVSESKHTIEFKDVWFRYPNTENYILKGISIILNSGDKLSVVGLNGCGKTTFIKLMCRLYPVTRGEILLDGININNYEYEDYVKLYSVVFQDFKLLSFTVKENISVTEDNIEAEKPIEKFLELAGIHDRVNEMPNGIHTNLFKQFDDKGIEPSGGEQQKLAIARALYKDSPIVILDEPTAALDPLAEYEIYSHFNSLVSGKTAVYISHRLSSCRFCDNIAVFSDGTIKEFGTHDDLLAANGLYSEMFNAQAKYYKNESTSNT